MCKKQGSSFEQFDIRKKFMQEKKMTFRETPKL